jgi:DNA-binding transcriptional LysR family regulator
MDHHNTMSELDIDDDDSKSSRPSVRELEVLHAVITTRKTTAAAQRLRVSQPAVSRAIAALETKLSRQLFIRDGGRLVPTADAFALDAEAAPIFASLARLEHWPRASSSGSVLRISTTETTAQAFLNMLITRYLKVEPDIRIHMEVGKAPDAVIDVADGSTDLGIVDTPMIHAGVRFEPFRQSIAHVVMPVDHPLAAKTSVSPQDLMDMPLITLTRRFSARAKFDRAFADQGVEPRIAVESASPLFVAELVRNGIGIGLVNPFPLAYVTGSKLTFRPFEPTIDFEAGFLFPATGANLPVARRFVDFVREEQMSLTPVSD